MVPMWTRPAALISNSTTYPAAPKGKISSRTNGPSSVLRQLNGQMAKNWHACRIASIALVGFSRTPVGLFSFHPKAKSKNLLRSTSASRLKTI
jgi:hypothetical protein